MTKPEDKVTRPSFAEQMAALASKQEMVERNLATAKKNREARVPRE